MKFNKKFLDFLTSIRPEPAEIAELKPFVFKLVNYVGMARNYGLLGHVEWAIMAEEDPVFKRYLQPVCDGLERKDLDFALYTALGLFDLPRVEQYRHYLAWFAGCCLEDGSSRYAAITKFALLTGLTWEELSDGSSALTPAPSEGKEVQAAAVEPHAPKAGKNHEKLRFKDLAKVSSLELSFIFARLKDEQIAHALTGTADSFKEKILATTTRQREGRIRELIGRISPLYDHQEIKKNRKILVYRLRHLGKWGV